jgi:hypothetical protein
MSNCQKHQWYSTQGMCPECSAASNSPPMVIWHYEDGTTETLTPAQAAYLSGAAQPKMGTKHDSGKVDLTLIPYSALEVEAKVWEFGAKKYGRENYKAGFPILRLLAALLRHTFAIVRGEDLDPESGLPHAGHARCCLGMIIECQHLGTLVDDRFKKVDTE